jgi:flagellar FliL protein
MSKAAEPAADAGKQKKGKGKLLIILVVVLVLGLGGGAAAYFFMGRGAETAKKGDEHGEGHEAEPGHEPSVITLPTFTVNLADKESVRYLRTSVSLVVNDAEKAAELAGGGHMGAGEPVRIAMARSAILELLTTKTADELMSAEGKTALKKEIAERASKAFRFKVNDVLLAEFVVQ